MEGVRYSGPLQANNGEILAFGSPYGVSGVITAYALNMRYLGHARVLEIGCGEAHASRVLLERTKISMDLVDINPEMTAVARQRVRKFKNRARVITEDAYQFLEKVKNPYPVIFSSFVLHNFKRLDRQRLLRLCHKAMQPCGLFILNDCIPPDHGDKALLKRQLRRYEFLPEAIREPLIEHVERDARWPYRMPEYQIRNDLNVAGFHEIECVDRVDREALIFALA